MLQVVKAKDKYQPASPTGSEAEVGGKSTDLRLG